jgi:archaemetzincin
MAMAGLDLVPFYLSDRQRLLDQLSQRLMRSLQVPIRLRKPWFDPETAFDPSRGQYNSTRLLRMLLDHPSSEAEKILGVTGVDLFTPVLTYVFGEAQLEGRAAVVSIHRLRAEVYGLPPDDSLLFGRLLKESVHELGHSFGLLHCSDPGCVMHASTYAEEIDLKSVDFCTSCREIVHSQGRLRAAGEAGR